MWRIYIYIQYNKIKIIIYLNIKMCTSLNILTKLQHLINYISYYAWTEYKKEVLQSLD